MRDRKIRWIAQTAVLTALLLVLQFVTKPMGQIVTGSSVNAVLAVAALAAGLSSGLCVAVLSPIFAFILGIGPQLFPLTPAIAAGNCVLVLALHFICREDLSIPRRAIACITASVCKFLTLYLLIVKLLCSIMELADKQAATFTAMFSWPQLITALIGSALALVIVPRIRTANGRPYTEKK